MSNLSWGQRLYMHVYVCFQISCTYSLTFILIAAENREELWRCQFSNKHSGYGETLVVLDKRHSGETVGVTQQHLSVFAHTLHPPSLRSRSSQIFAATVSVIVFSLSRCPPVTTVFSHTVWAKPRCDSDFQNSVCVTVPGSLVPPQKQTWFSFSYAPNGSPVFLSSRHWQRSLQVPLWGSFSFFSLFLQQGCGDVESFCISDCIPYPGLWWMSCFLWRFLFMTVTIHFCTYRHCTERCYVMGLLCTRRIDLYTFL